MLLPSCQRKSLAHLKIHSQKGVLKKVLRVEQAKESALGHEFRPQNAATR